MATDPEPKSDSKWTDDAERCSSTSTSSFPVSLQHGDVELLDVEKSTPTEDNTLSEKSSAPNVENVRSNELLPAWRPSILRIGPLAGLAALLLSFAQIFAAYGVLKGSDGALVTSWKWQPTVYIAILSAVSNKALAFAAVQGTVVTFWLRVLHGTTLGQLHRDWSYGLHAVGVA